MKDVCELFNVCQHSPVGGIHKDSLSSICPVGIISEKLDFDVEPG